MKNKTIIIILICLSIISISTTSVVNYNNYNFPEKSNSLNYEININGLNIGIDARMELLFIIQYLSDYFLINNLNIKYKNEIDDWFGKYNNHDVVSQFNGMLSNGFGYDAPPTFMLYLDENFEPARKYTDDLINRSGGKIALDKFALLLKDFSEKSKFLDFFRSQKNFYKVILNDIGFNLQGFNEISTMENYFGEKQKKYTVILTPLGQGNFGPRIKTDDGYEVYSINGTRGQNGDIPTFGDKAGFEYLVWHEFGHSFVNPLTEKYLKEVEKVKYLFEPIQEDMDKIAYGDWTTCVNEHIIRAYTSRLKTIKHGKEAGFQAMRSEIGRKFIYVKQIMTKLLEFENNRDKYKSFNEFYPSLISSFSSFTNEDADLIPTINSAINKKSVIIVSSNEPGEKSQKEIMEFVQSTKEMFFGESEIISDKKALKQDLSQNDIIVFGSINGNLWLKKHIRDLPVEFGPNSITADKQYKGEHLRFISSWKNPFNQEKNMIIYAALNPKDVLHINGVFHGPSNYIIADGKNILKSSFYSKKGNSWICF